MSANITQGPPPINYATHPRRLALSRARSVPLYSADQSTVSDGTSATTTPLQASVDPTTSSPNRVNVDSAASLDGLAVSFHHLSISGSSQNIQRRPFAAPTFTETYHYAPPKKYYSVTVGRRTSVFFPWSQVKPLVEGVSGGLAVGFKTHDAAMHDYLSAKDKGLVRVVRNPGDDVFFGPRSEAEM